MRTMTAKELRDALAKYEDDTRVYMVTDTSDSNINILTGGYTHASPIVDIYQEVWHDGRDIQLLTRLMPKQ